MGDLRCMWRALAAFISATPPRLHLQVMVNCSNGFAVAECDLELRGAGEVLGKRQSGRDVKTTFKVRPRCWCWPHHSEPICSSGPGCQDGAGLLSVSRPAPLHALQLASIPGDRELLEEARKAASRLLAEQPDPRQWPRELRALVADRDLLLQLDTLGLPSLERRE